MRNLKLLALAATLFAITAAAPPKPRNWMAAVETAQGWRFGNPAAPAKLVEYASLNCPHCARFAGFAAADIKSAVRAGRLSFEYRPYQIFPHDVASTLIARCVAPTRRLSFIEDYHRDSATYTDRMKAAAGDAALAQAREQGVGAFNRKAVALTGMNVIAGRHGLTPAMVNRCVADSAGLAWIEKAQAAAKQDGVAGTPTFSFNGKRVTIDSREELRTLLAAR